MANFEADHIPFSFLKAFSERTHLSMDSHTRMHLSDRAAFCVARFTTVR